VRGHRPAEPAADDDRVELGHGGSSYSSCFNRRGA
jgi:hypothetical protein